MLSSGLIEQSEMNKCSSEIILYETEKQLGTGWKIWMVIGGWDSRMMNILICKVKKKKVAKKDGWKKLTWTASKACKSHFWLFDNTSSFFFFFFFCLPIYTVCLASMSEHVTGLSIHSTVTELFHVCWMVEL